MICTYINGTLINGPFIAPMIDMQQENSNEIGSFMPIRTINNLNTNIAVNASAGSIISNNYLSNNDVALV
ncbi:MAG TPA: hypothetical protein VFR65_07740 [Nitrososphaeraceae archaeon]|nr:hypothetical protein [Nitrososphaeraceae archaeon]